MSHIACFHLLFTDINSGATTSQAESPVPFRPRGPLAAGELSDDDDSNDASNCDSFHRSTENSVGCKTTAAFASPSDVDGDGDGEDDEDSQNTWSLHGTETTGIATQSDLPQSQSKLADPKIDVAPLSSSFLSLGLNCRPAEWNWSPELDHRAVVEFKSLMRKKGLSMAQQQCCHIDEASCSGHCPTPLLQDPKENPAGELGSGGAAHSVNTVTLRRGADESFGINVEMTPRPLKVVVTRLNPGGAAGRVRVSLMRGHWPPTDKQAIEKQLIYQGF